MPPKTLDQRKASKRTTATPSIKRELDLNLYQRKQHEFPPLGDVLPLEPRLTGEVANIETLFPEWTVEGENWSESVAPETEASLRYPNSIDATHKASVREILGLIESVPEGHVAADTKKGKDSKKPPPPKKAAAVEANLTDELLVDEHGRKLPRVYLEVDSEKKDSFEAFPIPRLFARDWSSEQNQRRQLQRSLLARIDEATSEEEKELFKTEYESALAERDVEKEEPAGEDRDPYIVSAYKFIARFAPTVITGASDAQSDQMRYLWRAVYPQLTNGKPYYNPSGKYCVRLFLAGKWRKVTVSDIMPVDDRKKYSLASSIDPYELWPAILSKAIYTVFSACGYSDVFKSVETDPKGNASLKAAYFVSNAVYLLTGWQPGTPWSLGETIGYDLPRARSLLEEVLFSGAATVAPIDIPGEPPKVGTDNILAGAENGDRLLTAKQFRDEYSLRFQAREEILNDIATREERIARIEAVLSKAFSESYAIFSHTPDGVGAMHPILGLSFPDDSEDMRDIKVLTHWKVGTPERTILIQRSDDIAKLTEGLDEPFPPTTPIESQWVTFRELIHNGAYCVGLDTQTRLAHKAVLGWHWGTLEPSPAAADPKGAKGKKEKEQKGAPAPSNPVDTGCGDMGAFPPALIVLDSSSFFIVEEPPAADPTPVIPPLPLDGLDGNAVNEEALAALSMQAAELQELQQSKGPTYTPKDTHLSISMSIQADLPKPTSINTGNSMSSSMSGSAGPSASTEKKGSSQVQDAAAALTLDPVHTLVASLEGDFVAKLPSDVVLVLQELRTDHEDPLVMRLELGENALVPVARATFHIPASKIRPNEKLVFWVRLFTKASVFMTFGCGVPIVAGELEQVWKEQLHGSVFTREGEAGPTRPHTEQLLFRIPLQLEVSGGQDAEEHKEHDTKHGHKKKGGKEKAEHTGADSSGVSVHDVEPVDDLVTMFLFISDREIARTVSTMLLTSTVPECSPDEEEESGLQVQKPGDMTYTMPRIQGNVLLLSTSMKKIRTLIARCFPPAAGKMTVPPFKWKLFIISKVPIANKFDPTVAPLEAPVSQRYSGKYFPNNHLVVFRDVLAVPKDSTNIAMKLTLQNILDSSVIGADTLESSVDFLESLDHDVDIAEGVNLNVKLLRKGDRKLIMEYHGRSIIPIYNIPVSDFVMEPVKEVPSTDAAPPAKGAKGAKKEEKGGKGGKHAEEPPVEIIIECSIDQNTMQVPLQWRSRRPFDFDGILSAVAHQAIAASASNTQIPTEATSPAPSARQPNSARTPNSARRGTTPEAIASEPAPVIGGLTAPIVYPQFAWQMDILAGNVTRVTHDMYDLERRMQIKNSWEEASAGRALKAEAAMKYYYEKKRAVALDENSAAGDVVSALEGFPVGNTQGSAPASPLLKSISGKPGSSQGSARGLQTPVSARTKKGAKAAENQAGNFIQLLATALEVELPTVEEREKLLMSKQNQYVEHIEPSAPGVTPQLVDENTIIAQREREEKDWQETQKLPEDLARMIAKLTKDIRHYAKVRLQRIHEEAVANAQALAEPWKDREKFRLYVEKKNADLAEDIARREEEAAATAAAASAAAGKKPEKRRSITKKK